MRPKNVLTLGILGLLVVLFLIYRYGFQTRYLNIVPQTTLLHLIDTNQVLLLEKHPEQKNIAQLELSVSGKLSDNITLYLSPNGLHAGTSIRLKKGNVKTSFITKWKNDRAYIFVENPHASENKLTIEYQFVSNF